MFFYAILTLSLEPVGHLGAQAWGLVRAVKDIVSGNVAFHIEAHHDLHLATEAFLCDNFDSTC